jgi:hypothetical protein
MLSVSMWTSRMVQTAIELGIPDAIPIDGGASATTLADLTGTRPDLLARLLRALSAHGVFALAEDGVYVHTEVSLVLRNDHPHTVRRYAAIFANQWMWKACAAMTDVVRTGRDPLLTEFGRPMWAYLASEPAEALAFQQGMTDFARLFAPSLAEALELRDARTVVDVGGGQGILLGAVLDRHPDVDGVLFENETVLASLRADRLTAQFIDRFRLMAGNALEAVDCPADVYLFSNFLHLFEDDDAIRMLTNCAATAPPGARIIAMERVIADGPQDTFGTMLDLMMLCLNHGLERTEEEFHTLFERAGLGWVGITAATGDVSIIEGVVRPAS